MCGITGWIDWEQDLTQQKSVIEKMANVLRHRGPDADGIWLSPRATLAHRRLIVIDPACGTQPMTYEDEHRSCVLTYNGEIYNFHELRAELEKKGHRFKSHSDTEVLLHTYLEWGDECVNHLNGIFAFGLWDANKQRLLLARDHLGVKPLFYAQRGSAVLFGSELKALLAHPQVKAEIDADGLAQVFSFAPVHAPGFATYRDIHELRPGHRMVFERGHSQTTQYWSLKSAPHTDDLDLTTSHIRALLEDIVERQLIADVPVVAMLSGGLDSSSLTALAARSFKKQGKQLNTYSVDFVDSAQHFKPNEMHISLDAPWVARVVEHAGTNHHTELVDSPELLEQLLVPMRAHDLPALGQMETSLYLLFKAMKQNATVALSGESADEVFGGYPWFNNEAAFNAQTFPWLTTLHKRREVPEGGSWLSPETQARANPEAYMQRRYHEALAELPRLEGEAPAAAKRREMFFMNLTRFLPVLLDRKDRMSMAVGFEVRVPFCDYRLVQYVWNIPWEMKRFGDIEKGILRRAVRDLLPEDVRMRRKSPYPASQHPSYAKGIHDWMLQILNDSNSPVLPFINTTAVRSVVEGKTPMHSDPFWLSSIERLIQINAWLKEYHVRVV